MNDLEKILLEQLQSWAEAGVTHLPRAKVPISLLRAESVAEIPPTPPQQLTPAGVAETKTPVPIPDRPRPAAPQTPSHTGSIAKTTEPQIHSGLTVDKRPYPPSLLAEKRVGELAGLAENVAGCTRCSALSRCRKQTVFGVGNPQTRLCFFGEAPGADEDRLGEPFVGAAGQLLDKIIVACQWKREDVYILNTVKCRPPENRNPTEEEMHNCWEYAERQLEIIRPEFICCLGKVAAQALLKTTEPIGHLRGRFHHYRNSRVIVTYHPAYLLRTESAKKLTWDDMKMLKKEMGDPLGNLNG